MTDSTIASSSSNTLLVLIVDVSPTAWGDRDSKRTQRDLQRISLQNKRSIGPAILNELIHSLCAYIIAITSMEKQATIIIIGVANNDSAILYPNKDILNTWLHSTNHVYTPNIRTLQQDFIIGISELVQRAAKRYTDAVAVATAVPDQKTPPPTTTTTTAAMASAFSKALCIINRLLVAAQSGYGVSALSSTSQFLDSRSSSSNQEDAGTTSGVIALMSTSKQAQKQHRTSNTSAWSPRIMIVQVSSDRSYDYNAFMNCAFAAAKHHIVVDGCYLSSELSNTTNNNSTSSSSSSFLEQTCDITGGIYLAPSGAAQVGGALTAVLFAVFLAPLSCRYQLNLPTLHKVDYRARCFDTGETIDMAYVCNQCLSIFKEKPQSYECTTCHAPIVGNEQYRPTVTTTNGETQPNEDSQVI